MNLEELSAIEGIRRTLAEYVFHTDNGRVDEFAALFGRDGVFVLPDGSEHAGAVAISTLLKGHAAYFASNPGAAPPGYLRHQLTTHDIRLTSRTTATVEAYFMSLTAKSVDHWGRWDDELELQDDGRWRFKRRVVTTDGYHPTSWFATSFSK